MKEWNIVLGPPGTGKTTYLLNTVDVMHSDKKSKNQTGNSAAMFIKPKNHKIDLILP